MTTPATDAMEAAQRFLEETEIVSVALRGSG